MLSTIRFKKYLDSIKDQIPQEMYNQLWDLFLSANVEAEELKSDAKGWPGTVAKQYGLPVGTMGCPHCGVAVHGAIYSSTCRLCEIPFWRDMDQWTD